MTWQWFTDRFDDTSTTDVSLTALDKALLSSALYFLFAAYDWSEDDLDDIQAKLDDLNRLLS